jgi:hypothetical protein
MKTILYISTNDGSDMRITKEVKALSSHAKIIFIGVGKVSDKSYAQKYCEKFFLAEARRNSLKAFLLMYAFLLKTLFKNKITSIHIINEQLMVFFYPFLYFKHTVLDVFDSILLKKGIKKNRLNFLKKILYLPINTIIVTDDNRKMLMPNFLHEKITVVENFPYFFNNKTTKKYEEFTIFYGGSLSVSRGTEILSSLINQHTDINIIAAGWIADEKTRVFINQDRVSYLGVISQDEAQVVAQQCHYIMCCYEPINLNNINASPNKIYDSIQIQTPVIINMEVKVSKFVNEINIGFIIPDFYNIDIEFFGSELKNLKNSFHFEESNKLEYSWEKIIDKLLQAHGLLYNEA